MDPHADASQLGGSVHQDPNCPTAKGAEEEEGDKACAGPDEERAEGDKPQEHGGKQPEYAYSSGHVRAEPGYLLDLCLLDQRAAASSSHPFRSCKKDQSAFCHVQGAKTLL